jgi:hypothetical protein
VSGRLSTLNLQLLPTSKVEAASAEWALTRQGGATRLVIAPKAGAEAALAGFEGYRSDGVLVGPTSSGNAAALRSRLEWLRPRTLGTQTSAGLGDRLGLATPGHVRAVRRVGGGIAPIFPQQSIREMARTNRTPVEVMDDATWGMFAEGWKDGTGADADPKTTGHRRDPWRGLHVLHHRSARTWTRARTDAAIPGRRSQRCRGPSSRTQASLASATSASASRSSM